MCRTMGGPLLYLLASLLGLACLPTTTDAADYYDVSYVWSRSIDGVRDYRKQVAGVLGPAVAKDLKVVTRDNLIGLVYVRHGDSAGATRVAKIHTGLLRAQGLDAASPIRSENWTLVGDAVAASSGVRMTKTATAPAVMPVSSRSRMTSTERTREIHNLEAAVEDYINRLRKDGKLDPDERTGWSVYDFTTGEKLVTINEDEQFQAASLVKPFIAAAFFYKVEKGELSYNRESRRHMEQMIQHSYSRFIQKVSEGRNMMPEDVEKIAQGRVWAGKTAKELGLVDAIGNLQDAIGSAAEMAALKVYDVIYVKQPLTAREKMIKRLNQFIAGVGINIWGQTVPRAVRMYEKFGSELEHVMELNDPKGVYAYCLKCEIN